MLQTNSDPATPWLPVRTVVVDFDGTICRNDVSEEILEAFAPGEWWDIDLEFQRGEIGSRECLVQQAGLLAGSRAEMLAFVLDRFVVDPTFPPFATWAGERGLTVAVASDGLGFYVEPMLRVAGVEGIPIFTNTFAIGPHGIDLAFPHAHPECIGCGTCKMRVVLGYRERAGKVAFVGEGHSDRFGALYSDLVFAKKHLVDICRRDGVAFVPWESFDDVRAALERTGEPEAGPGVVPGRVGPSVVTGGVGPSVLPGRVAPAVCPGWTVP